MKRANWKLASIVAVCVFAVILASVGVYYYQLKVAPFRQPVLTVDDTSISMGYFLKRVRMVNREPATVLEQLAYEQVVRMMAPEYGVTVSQAEVEKTLHNQASTSSQFTTEIDPSETNSQTASDSFEKWYDQQLKSTGLSDAEYKNIIRINLLAARLQEHLADTVPTRGEQVRLHVIAGNTSDGLIKAKARINGGESFASVAAEVSMDAVTKANGGDIGWVPRGLLSHEDIIFQLEVGQVSDPVLLNASASGTRQYAIFMISQKDSARQIEDNALQMLRSMALYTRLQQEMTKHIVTYNFDTETQEWVSSQLTKDTQT